MMVECVCNIPATSTSNISNAMADTGNRHATEVTNMLQRSHAWCRGHMHGTKVTCMPQMSHACYIGHMHTTTRSKLTPGASTCSFIYIYWTFNGTSTIQLVFHCRHMQITNNVFQSNEQTKRLLTDKQKPGSYAFLRNCFSIHR